MSISIGQQAVVIGAGLAGLTAAAALSDFLRPRLVLERDDLPPEAGPRSGRAAGTASASPAGRRPRRTEGGFPRLRPGPGRRCASTWTPACDARDRTTRHTIRFPSATSGLPSTPCRARCLSRWCVGGSERIGNVSINSQCPFVRSSPRPPNGSPQRGRSLRFRRGGQRDRCQPIWSSMLRDRPPRWRSWRRTASPAGRKRPSAWICAIPAPLLPLPDDATPGWKGVVTFPGPALDGRGVVLFPIEGGRWMLGWRGPGDAAPADVGGFKEFARQPCARRRSTMRSDGGAFDRRDRPLRLPRQRAPLFRTNY